MPMKWTYKIFMNSQFKIQANCNDHKKFQKDLLIRDYFKIEPEKWFFCDFFWFAPDFWDPWVLHLRTGWSHKNYIKTKIVEFSKSKTIMCLWFLALKARKAGNRPRTFYTGLTVVVTDFVTDAISTNSISIYLNFYWHLLQLYSLLQHLLKFLCSFGRGAIIWVPIWNICKSSLWQYYSIWIDPVNLWSASQAPNCPLFHWVWWIKSWTKK